MTKIKGGYYIKARCIQDSKIAIMPPYVREIWDWLLKEANHTDNKSNGTPILRGQLIRTFKDIQEGLKWQIGYRKMTYKKWQCENAMKFLRKQGMVTTMKTTRGMFVTVCKYSHYQDPKNYESNTRAVTRTTREQQLTDTINKNDKNDKNVKKKKVVNVHFNYEEGKFIGITNGFLSDLKKRYPNCDVNKQFRKMTNWLVDNQNKKRQGKRAFIDNWMERNNRDEKERKELGIDNLQTLTGHLKE